jgi:acyl-CoA synthetase (AMP-forming)/AMP-acid ligase II
MEDLLVAHPAVDDVAVIGVPDDEYGQSVMAVVIIRDGYVGLRPGDHIAVLMGNRLELFPVVWAAQGILPALTGQPFGTGLNIDHTMRNVLGFSSATVYLCPGPLYHGAPIGWSRIARYKAPRTVSFTGELPRLPSGKMLRRLLMDRYREDQSVHQGCPGKSNPSSRTVPADSIPSPLPVDGVADINRTNDHEI